MLCGEPLGSSSPCLRTTAPSRAGCRKFFDEDLITFYRVMLGAGLLAASLIPASSKEKDLAATVKEQAQPLVDEVTDAAKEIGEHLKEPLQASVESVKSSAQDSVATVKDEAQGAASDVKDQAQRARDNISDS